MSDVRLWTFASYRIRDVLDVDLVSTTYRATTIEGDALCRLRVFTREGADGQSVDVQDAIVAEALRARKVRHPHILATHDAGHHDGRVYVVSDHINGTVLRELIARRPLVQPRTSLAMGWRLAEALDAVHAGGIVHGSINPHTIWVADSAGRELPMTYLTGFGSARALAREVAIQGGAPASDDLLYFEADQVHRPHASPEADRFALGCAVYHLLTGVPPFRHGSGEGDDGADSRGTFDPPSAVRHGLPPALDAVFARALARRSSERFPSAHALMIAVERALRDRSGGEGRRSARPAADGRRESDHNVMRAAFAATDGDAITAALAAVADDPPASGDPDADDLDGVGRADEAVTVDRADDDAIIDRGDGATTVDADDGQTTAGRGAAPADPAPAPAGDVTSTPEEEALAPPVPDEAPRADGDRASHAPGGDDTPSREPDPDLSTTAEIDVALLWTDEDVDTPLPDAVDAGEPSSRTEDDDEPSPGAADVDDPSSDSGDDEPLSWTAEVGLPPSRTARVERLPSRLADLWKPDDDGPPSPSADDDAPPLEDLTHSRPGLGVEARRAARERSGEGMPRVMPLPRSPASEQPRARSSMVLDVLNAHRGVVLLGLCTLATVIIVTTALAMRYGGEEAPSEVSAGTGQQAAQREPAEEPGIVHPVWTTQLESQPVRSIVVADDVVLVATDTAIAAVEPVNGERLWSHAIDADLTELVVVRDMAITAGSDGVAGYDIVSGRRRWALPSAEAPDALFAGAREAYAATRDDSGIALSAITPTGIVEPLGTVPEDDLDGAGRGRVSLAFDTGGKKGDPTLYVLTRAALHAFDLETRIPRWRAPVDGDSLDATVRLRARAWPESLAVAGGAVVVADRDGGVCRHAGDTGDPVWTECQELPAEATSAPQIEVRRGRVVTTSADAIAAYDFTNGRPLWMLAPQDHVYAAVASGPAAAFVADADGGVEALDQASGQRQWRSPDIIEVTVLVADSDGVFVGGTDGSVTRLLQPPSASSDKQ